MGGKGPVQAMRFLGKWRGKGENDRAGLVEYKLGLLQANNFVY